MMRPSQIEVKIHGLGLKTIMNSGQCFRMSQIEPGRFAVTAWGRHLEIEELGEDLFRFHCDRGEFDRVWNEYFDLEADYCCDWIGASQSDAYLRAAMEYGAGMRILKQDPWETLATFIISQRKSIPAICVCVELLCQRYGKPIEGTRAYAFPEPETLAELDEKTLMTCKVGYRAKYILDAARRVASGALDLDFLFLLQDDELKKALMEVYGVGEKVACCVMLYAYHRLSAFPVDTWVRRIVEKEYAGRLPLLEYGLRAGVLQQYIFLYERFLAGRIRE
jgi:N-glycosylase/DNA lyase